MKPLLQVQLLNDELPRPEKECGGQAEQALEFAVEYVPFGHTVQFAAPDDALYLPASQLVQSPPLGPIVPGSHSQSEMDELPAGDDDDAGQSEQAPADVAPSCDENVPGAHSLQASAPAIDL